MHQVQRVSAVVVIANNSFYRERGLRRETFPSALTTPSIENNHFDQNAALIRRQNNDVTTLAALNALAFAKHNIEGDPRYIDEAQLDFALEPNSPLIDTGKDRLVWSFLDINVLIRPYDDTRVRGPSSPRDIGPHEWFGTKLAATGPKTPGSTVNLPFVAPSAPNRNYAGGASLSAGPITIDQRVIYLGPDPLLFASALGYLGSVFPNFTGTLDATGTASPAIRLPQDQRLKGQTFYAAFLVLDPTSRNGVRDITRTVEIVVQ